MECILQGIEFSLFIKAIGYRHSIYSSRSLCKQKPNGHHQNLAMLVAIHKYLKLSYYRTLKRVSNDVYNVSFESELCNVMIVSNMNYRHKLLLFKFLT